MEMEFSLWWLLLLPLAWWLLGCLAGSSILFCDWYQGNDIRGRDISEMLRNVSLWGPLAFVHMAIWAVGEILDHWSTRNPRILRGRKSAALARELSKPREQ